MKNYLHYNYRGNSLTHFWTFCRDGEFPDSNGTGNSKPTAKDGTVMDAKERKRHDRFNGLSEEEVSRKTLPDHIAPNLDILMVIKSNIPDQLESLFTL